MPSKRRRWIFVGSLTAGAISIAVGLIHWACQQSPEFYSLAITQNQAQAQQDSDALVRQAALLASDVRRPGRWQALFTAEQINGWLTCDAQRNHVLSPNISDLRVNIEPQCSEIAFRWHSALWSAIVSLQAEVYLQRSNVVAIRVCKARAGILPLPLGGVVGELINSARNMGLQIDEQEIDGDPLIIVTLPWEADIGNKQLCLESLELSDGQIYLAVRCEPISVAIAPHKINGEPPGATAQPDSDKVNVQR